MLPKTFLLSIPGLCQSRTWRVASLLLAAIHLTQILVSGVEAFTFEPAVLASLYSQEKICCPSGVPMHVLVTQLDAELLGLRKVCPGARYNVGDKA